MSSAETVTCSFTMDRKTYNDYKSVVVRRGENVKGNLIAHMNKVIGEGIPNTETLNALEELKEMKKNPEKYKSYTLDELFNE